MKAGRNRPAGQLAIRWAAMLLAALCWTFALATRYSSFSIAGRSSKATILVLLFIPAAFLAAWLFHDLLPRVFGPIKTRTLHNITSFGALAAALYLLLVYSPPPFPEHHVLEIFPYKPDGLGALEIISVHRIELPGGERLVVPPGKMEQYGGWNKDQESDALVWTGEPEAFLQYARLMQAGMEIVFRSGPRQSGARVVWDGQEYLLDLTAPVEGEEVLLLQPALDWRRADLNRKILVGAALLCEFLGLAIGFSIAGALLFQVFIGKTIKLRAAKPVLLCALALGLLLPAVIHINPPAAFEDEGLEMAVREILDKPVGPLYHNALRTIAELDASERGITSLTGIGQLSNLVSLNLRGNQINDLSPLTSLKRLQKINLRDNPLEDISPLAELERLEYLNLHSNYRIDSLEPLRDLRGLRTLILAHVPVGGEADMLANFSKMVYLNLRETGITDISSLSSMTELKYLNLHSNHRIRSLAPLEKMGKLETLILAHVPVGDQIRLLAGMPALSHLNLRDCGVSDVTAVSKLMAGGSLQDRPEAGRIASIDLRDNPLLTPMPASDPFSAIRPYWENIFHRQPFDLPPQRIQAPEFSQPGGFYPTAFNLTLLPASPGDVIYYTEDGSEPNIRQNAENTRLYKEPIPITPKSGYRLPINPDSNSRFSNMLNYGARVIRAVSVNQDHIASEVATHTYIIDEEFAQTNRLPVLSITTDPENLYDHTAGIFIKGQVFEDWKGYFKERYPRSSDFNYPANYHQRGRTHLTIGGLQVQEYVDGQVAFSLPDHGLVLDFNYWRTVPLITIKGTASYDGRYYLSPDSDKDTLVIQKAYVEEIFPPGAQIIQNWEQPVHLEYFDSDGSLAFSQDLGMRVHGGASRGSNQKSLRFYARSDYSGQDLIRYALFPDDDTDKFQRFLLRMTTQRSGLNDIIGQQFMQAVHPDMDIQRYQPVMVFINGDFWGWYNLRDRYDDRYLAYKYSIHRHDIAFLEEGTALRYGQPGDVDDFLDLDNFIRTADLREDASFARVAQEMDIENYTDYMLSGIFLDYRDWGPKHDQKWRFNGDNSMPGAPPALDGRWRWMPLDMDQAMLRKPDSEYLQIVITTGENYLPYFLLNENYRSYFINRFADLMNTSFREEASAELVKSVLDQLPEELIEENINRWQNMSSLQEWLDIVEQIQVFLRDRPLFMRAEVVDFFDLNGIASLTVEADSEQGSVQINTITITPETPGMDESGRWSGVYFQGNPLEIRAIPYPGYQFLRWEGVDRADPNLSLRLTKDLSLRAVFIASTQ